MSNTDGLNLLINVRSNGDRFYARVESVRGLVSSDAESDPYFCDIKIVSQMPWQASLPWSIVVVGEEGSVEHFRDQAKGK